jgi:carboxyl-terminal processing protease
MTRQRLSAPVESLQSLAVQILAMQLLAMTLLVSSMAPARGDPQDAVYDPASFDVEMAADVFATSLAFMAPRTLDPVPVSQLTIWGLNGLSALDPRLAVAVRDNRLVLSAGNDVLLATPLPAEGDADAWAVTASNLSRTAWIASGPLRRAGTQGIISSFFDELFNHLDPYSRYTPPDQASADTARRDGSAGIGVELTGPPGLVAIGAMKEDGPAAVAGLRIGERILAVDGQPTQRQSATTIAGWLAGPANTQLVLTLARPGSRPREVALTRTIVTPETVFVDRSGDILILRVVAFSRDTEDRIAAELLHAIPPAPTANDGTGTMQPARAVASRHSEPAGSARTRPPRGVVLDLRGNRGGLLRQAVLAADAMLAGGVVAVTSGRNPQASVVWRASPDDLTHGVPIVVLVDGRTASAAEILAAALQDQGRAVVVGSATLGKGLVQTVSPLPDGGELFISWSRVLAPSGYPLQGLGVLPQICTSLGQQALERQMAALPEHNLLMRQALLRHALARAPVSPPQMLELRAPCPAAEGREDDMRVARALLADSAAYAGALLVLPVLQ